MWKKVSYLLKKRKLSSQESSPAITNEIVGKRKAFVFNDTRPDQHFGCDCVMENLMTLLDASGIIPSYFYDVGKDWKKDKSVPIRVAECDIIIVNGEGSIHHSNRRARSLSRVGKLAKSMGKPVVLLNATLFENDTKVYKNLSFFDSIYVRDSYSSKEAGMHGLKTSYAPDFTFYSDFGDAKERLAREDLKVLVGDSVIGKTAEGLDLFAQKHRFSRINILHKDEEPSFISEHVDKMSEADLLVTGRFHTVCFCLNAGIPFIATESNTNKISSLLDDCFNDRKRIVTVDKLDSIDISEFASFSEQEVLAIKAFKKRSRQCYEDICNRLKFLH